MLPHQRCLLEEYPFLVDHPVDEAVLDHVKKWLTPDERDKIDVILERGAKTRKFLDIMILKHDKDSFDSFIKGLRANRSTHVVCRLEERMRQIGS